jgi:hypothetical protein
MSDKRLRRQGCALVVGAALVILTACGSSTPQTSATSTPTTVAPLTKNQVDSALLTLADMGPGFKADPDATNLDDDDDEFGCISDLDAPGVSSPTVAEAMTGFVAEKDSLPALFNAVGTMKNEKQVEAAYNEFVAILKTCRQVSLAEGGVSLELMVSSNHDKTHKNVDNQVNVAALGTISSEGKSVPFGVWLSWMSLDNNITLVGYANANENGKTNRSLNAHAYNAFAKLQAVMEGKPLPKPSPPAATTA